MSTATVTVQCISDKADIEAVLDAVNQALYEKDAAAIVAHYTPHAPIFNLAPPLAHQGMDRRDLDAWLNTWQGPVERESRDFRFTVNGDFAFAYGLYRLSGMNKPAGRRIGFWMRATLCLLRDDGVWRIVHEHTSVPFYMDGSLRPAFDLEP